MFSKTSLLIKSFATLLIISFCCMMNGCMKATVDFKDNQPASDPNIVYIDTNTVNISTYMLDSFVTSGDSSFAIGFTRDTAFGNMQAATYMQINLPATNPVKDKTVLFDSLVIMLKPTGNYYGDTTLPVTFNAHRLLQNIENDEAGEYQYYNTRNFDYDAALFGQTIKLIKPLRDTGLIIRLPDAFGKELLYKLRDDNTDIQTNTDFIKYLKGIYIESDSNATNTIYYFKPAATGIMRLRYHVVETFSTEEYLDFPINISNHFNHIQFTHKNANLAAFTPYKNQLISSSLTGNKAYLHNNMGSYIKINFPSILSIKELHPYIKVLKAQLVVTPTPGTYFYPYVLPDALNLYVTDEFNRLNSIVTDATGQSALTGDLYIDDLYGENTTYTFDITSFINTLITEGEFTKTALMLYPSAGISDNITQRLVINNQQLAKAIKLKLYVLGL